MTEPATDPRFIRVTLTSIGGPLIWALHFGAVYGGQHVACRAALAGDAGIRTGIIAATIAAILVLLAVFLLARRLVQPAPPADPDVPAFLHSVTAWLLGLSLFAVLASGLAALMLPSCPSLR